MSLPVVVLTGSPFEQGVTHGRELKARVTHNRDIYFERFEREVKLNRAEVHTIADQYAQAIATQNADYFRGMEGVAEGSGLPFLDVVALNVRYEILYYQFGQIALEKAEKKRSGELPANYEIDGCTAFAVLPEATATGHLLMGENWDWIPEVQGAIIHTKDGDGSANSEGNRLGEMTSSAISPVWETLGYTEPGIVGTKIGLNSAGIGLAINGLTTTGDDWSRLAKPFHVRTYEILRSRTFEDAVNVVTGEARSCSTNFLIAQAPDKVVDIEAAPDTVNRLMPRKGCLTHANHFVDPDAMGIVETPNDRRIYSRHRESRLYELLLAATPVTVEAIQAALRDTQDDPFGICRHRDYSVGPEEHYTTVTAVVMDLHTKTLHLTDGPPDEAPFQTVSL